MNLSSLASSANKNALRASSDAAALSNFRLLPASSLKINFDVQQRSGYDPNNIREFARSIKAAKERRAGIEGTGYEQPINVYIDPHGQAWVTFGGRRTMAGQCEEVWSGEDVLIPAIVAKEIDLKEAALSSIVENEDRLPPTPLEQTDSYLRLFHDFDMSVEEIAVSRGWSTTAVHEILDRADYGEDLKSMMTARHDTKRIAREIHTKIANRDAGKRAEVVDLVNRGASYAIASAVIKKWEEERKSVAANTRMHNDTERQNALNSSSTSRSAIFTPASQSNRPATIVSEVKLPRVEYSRLSENLNRYTREAWEVCQDAPPQGNNRRNLLQAVEEAERVLANLKTILHS